MQHRHFFTHPFLNSLAASLPPPYSLSILFYLHTFTLQTLHPLLPPHLHLTDPPAPSTSTLLHTSTLPTARVNWTRYYKSTVLQIPK